MNKALPLEREERKQETTFGEWVSVWEIHEICSRRARVLFAVRCFVLCIFDERDDHKATTQVFILPMVILCN